MDARFRTWLPGLSTLPGSCRPDHFIPPFPLTTSSRMFGYPTGLGALIIRTHLVPLLHKVGFMGPPGVGAAVALIRPLQPRFAVSR